MSDLRLRIAVALLVNGAAAFAAVRKQSVTPGGGRAGFVIGAGIFVSGGAWLWALLMIFFVSSSAASRVGPRRKAALSGLHEKGSRRDAVQVFANGGVGLATAVVYALSRQPVFAFLCAASFAAASADTWAGEIGILSAAAPRSIVTLRRLPPGASGGVSLLGTVAAAAGAAVIAACFIPGWRVLDNVPNSWSTAAAITAAGFFGAMIDSVFGATLQAHYQDAVSGKLTERRHGAAGENRLMRGLRGFNNDAVNVAANLAALTLALLLYRLLP